jgi:cob(I)alamin adenosyltransferase
MKSKIYTKTGDEGTTSIIGGKRLKKNDIRIEAYGNIDELNSYVGMLAISAKLSHPNVFPLLRIIQNQLFNIGAYLATDNPSNSPIPAKGIAQRDVETLEAKIDELDGELPPLHNFILPGSSQLSSLAHICRTITRRCERRVIALADTVYIDPIVVKYLNRLSDFFFVFARFNNISNQIPENFWNKEC